jgi:hypothetical protein
VPAVIFFPLSLFINTLPETFHGKDYITLNAEYDKGISRMKYKE